MSDFKEYLINFNKRYSDFLVSQDSNSLHKLLKEAIPGFNSGENRLVASLHQQKARAYSLFAENTEMDRHFEAAINLIGKNESWKLYIDWANLYFMQLRIPEKQKNPNPAFENALNILKRIQLSTLKKDRFALWSVASFQSFCELTLSTNKTIPLIYKSLDFNPVPINLLNDKTKLKEFYAHFFKSIAIAIELRDSELMMKLLKMISIDDSLLHSNEPLLKKFQQILNDTMDLRHEFAEEFNFLFSSAPILKTNLPNFNLYISYLERQNFSGLHYFFTAIK